MKKQSESIVFTLNTHYSTTRRVTSKTPTLIQQQTTDKIQSVLFLTEHPDRKGQGGLRTHGYFKLNSIETPLISVITVVFNGANHIEQTINSVIEQTYDNVEYIIIDGGSTDGTLDIIRQYEGQIDYWVSEQDAGISDAFNKGILLCTGEIIGIINADDWYQNDIFETIRLQKKHDVIHGQLQYWKNDFKMELFIPDYYLLDKEMTLNHPTCFIRRDVYHKFGNFSNEFNIAMDYDFLLRIKNYNVSFLYLPIVIANMRYCGVSDIDWISTYRETFRVKVKNGRSLYLASIYFCYQILRRYIRIFFEKLGLQFFIRLYRFKFSVMKKW